jgi:outer membrane protein assembly factor BamB
VVNGIVYVGTGVNSASGTLDAFDAVTGVKKWSFQAGGSVNSNPAVVGGVVYFATYSGTVFAVNAVTGVQVWTASGPTADQYNVAVSNGAVYISGNGAITAFSVGSGLTLWSFPTSGGFGSPAVFNSRVFVGESDSSGYSYITALDAGSGNLVWRENLDGFCGYVSGANGVLYVPTYNGTIHAFNPADGTPLWTGFTGSHPSFGYPAAMVADGTVSVPGDNGIKIFGLNAAAARTHGPVAPPQIKTLKPDYSLSVR